MIDVQGLALTEQDRLLLNHPCTAGVILFSRNYADQAQLTDLIAEIRAASSERLLIAVDHEGGRVQRFRQGFTVLPPAQAYAELNDIAQAKHYAFDAGWLLAMELIAFDIDLSFAPVLDLGHQCLAIGTRSFHADRQIACTIAASMIDGMHQAGMKTTGKHFPGHGAVLADSHKETPIDTRSQVAILEDMQIFAELIKQDKLDAIMPAHVIYPAFDALPASGSLFWLKEVLHQQLQFTGVVFSDDLSMEGAAFLGDYSTRAQAALMAGCDILLACNNRQGTLEILASLQGMTSDKARKLLHKQSVNYHDLVNSSDWQIRHKRLTLLNDEWQKQHN